MPSPTSRRAWIWSGLLIIIISTLSGQSSLAVPSHPVLSHDKLAHFLVFGLVATSLIRAFPQHWSTLRRILTATVITSLFGALDEFHQSFTPGRHSDPMDWVFDTAGALLASVLYCYWGLYRRILEWRVFGSSAPQGLAEGSPPR